VEQSVELGAIGFHDLRVIAGQGGQQEEAKHAAFAVACKGHPFGFGGSSKAIDQGPCGGAQRIKKSGLADLRQSGQAARSGHRVAT